MTHLQEASCNMSGSSFQLCYMKFCTFLSLLPDLNTKFLLVLKPSRIGVYQITINVISINAETQNEVSPMPHIYFDMTYFVGSTCGASQSFLSAYSQLSRVKEWVYMAWNVVQSLLPASERELHEIGT